MKRIVVLVMACIAMVVSLGGCVWWGYDGRDRDRDGGYGRGGHEEGRGEHDHEGGGREGGRPDRY
ncbi:MAG TPA: hypothetical protein VMT62_12945 [Syntrophorhabdaceae bacterium]|nr:hypothetical protein [Syntrophorhabdaceae bacterium]